MKKLILSLEIIFGVFLVVSTVSASTIDQLQPAQTVTYNEEVVINSTLNVSNPGYFPQGVHIGSTEAGVGGVTYFNGTIVNLAVDEDGEDTIPVTFGDDVRIDGSIYRTEIGGDNALRMADTLMPAVNNTYSLGTSTNQFQDAYFAGTVTMAGLSGTGIVNTANIANNAVTQSAESSGNPLNPLSTTRSGTNYSVADTITITTSESSTLFCMWSGLVTTTAIHQTATFLLYVDGSPIGHTYRRETTTQGEGQSTVATSALVNVSAGVHTVEMRWNTDAGATANMTAHTLDVIELKK